MKISVIIPAKNEEKHLAKLLPALRKQTVQPEIIVAVAPGTKDRTKSVAKKHGARIVKGGLPGIGRNAGAYVAKGEYLFFLDADVLPGSKDFLEIAVKEMHDRKLNAASVHNYAAKREKLAYRIFFHVQNAVLRMLLFLKTPQVPGTCIIVRKSEHRRLKGFNKAVVWDEDVEYVQRTKRFGILPRTLFIVTSTRRLKKDGIRGTVLMAIKAQWHRITRGEIKDLSYIDEDYFEHEHF